MTLRALHRWSMIGCCALGALGTASGSPLLAMASLLLILVMILTGHQLHDVERPALRIWAVHGLTILGLVWALSVARTARIDSVVVVVFLGLFNRFVLRQGLRDDLILLGGAAVLLAVSTTITPGLAFLPLFVGFLWVSFGALRSAQILGLAETEPESRRAVARQALLQRPAPPGQAKLAVVAMVFVIFGAIGLAMFPKHQFARLLGAGAFMSLPGASEVMNLSNKGVSNGEDGTVVLRVSREGAKDTALSGLYARVYGLDRFDGRQWRREANGAAYPLKPRGVAASNPDSPGRVKVVLHRITRGRGLHPLVALGRQRPARVMGKVETRARQSVDGTWHVSIPQVVLSVEYRVDLAEPAPIARLPRAAQRALRQRWLALPDDLSPPIGALAQRLTSSATTTADKIRAVVGHFDAGYTYSLDPLPGDADDPLTRFLFEAKQGHCELYAGAVATLLRASGVPARVVTGYYGGYWNQTGQALEFSEQDAHAWVEAYDPARGWLWVDATPPNLRARRRGKAWAFLRDLYDTLEALWYSNVVDFDETKRQALVGRVFPEWMGAAGAGSPTQTFGAQGSTSRAASAALLVAGIGGLLLFAGWRVVRRTRSRLGQRLRGALDPQADPCVPLGRLVEQVPSPVRGQADEVVRAYEAWRFGGEPAAPPPTALHAAVVGLERAVAKARRPS